MTPHGAVSYTHLDVYKRQDKKDILRIKEEISIPGGMPNVFCLLWQDCRLKDMTFQIMDEKMTVQGELGLFFLYEGEGEMCIRDRAKSEPGKEQDSQRVRNPKI